MHLLYYGNRLLQTREVLWDFDGSRSTANRQVQSLELARKGGSAVVLTRRGSKVIEVNGALITDETKNLTLLMRDFDADFTKEEILNNHFLRIIRNYKNIINTSSISNWTASTGAENLVANSEKKQNPDGDTSIGFDITPTASGGGGNWYNINWSYRVKITVDNSLVSSYQTNIPIYVNLNDLPLSFFSNVKADGSDIVVTSSDGTTKLDRELVSINTSTSMGEIYFKASSLSSTGDTEFYVYYGYAAATETNTTATWSNNFAMTHHMNDTTTSTITDSTSNSNDGTKTAANEPIETSSGRVYEAQVFDGTNDEIDCGTGSSINFGTGDFSGSCWIKADSGGSGSTRRIIRKKSGTAGYSFELNSSGQLQLGLRDTDDSGTTNYASSSANLYDDTWHHVAFVRDNTNDELNFYLDGVKVGSTISTTGRNDLSNTNSVYIGGDGSLFDGTIDEVRLESTARSGDWFTIYHNNVTESFYSVSAEESGSTYTNAIITYDGNSMDLSGQTDTGNFEFSLFIPDATYVATVTFRIGNDSSNYYGYTFSYDYQGNVIHNGWNLFSVSWDNPAGTYPAATNRVAEVGTVDDSDIDYFVLQVNYTDTVEDDTGFVLDGILWVDEGQTRNFPGYRQDQISKSGQHFEIRNTSFSFSFFNNTGTARSTHEFDLFSQEDITTNSDTQEIELVGSENPDLTIGFTVDSSSNAGDISITNVDKKQAITLESGSLSANDIVVFPSGGLPTINGEPLDYNGRVPDFDLGKNRIRMEIDTSSTSETISQSTFSYAGSEGIIISEVLGNTPRRIARKFTPTTTGEINRLRTKLRFVVSTGIIEALGVRFWTDSAGSPGSIIGSSEIIAGQTGDFDLDFYFTTPITVSSGTPYWFELTALSDGVVQYYWLGNNSGGDTKYKLGTGSWTSQTGYDPYFTFDINPVPNWDINWTAKYNKLYQA